MSWRPEVVADSGNWVGNALRFGSKEEAEAYLANLSYHWHSGRESRVVECEDPINYRWVEGRLVLIGLKGD